MKSLSVRHVARIEGHGTITVDVAEGAVRDVRMDVIEPARLFESMVVGKPFDQLPVIASRICGICSPNHAVTSIKAIEDAFEVEISERTSLLRQLMVYGSFLQNHATHLYLFAAPDYVGEASAFPLATSAPAVLSRALRLKKLGNDLTTLVGGRSVHPITAVVGGFTSEPSSRELEDLAKRLRASARDASDTVELFGTFEVPEFETSGEMLGLTDGSTYAIYDGVAGALDAGWRRSVSGYKDYLAESVVSHSNAKHSSVDGRTVLVGAVARLNLSWEQLTPAARLVSSRAGLRPTVRNPFHNNLCQAVELVDAVERCALLCERLLDESGTSKPQHVDVKSGTGFSATEAPRGTLYHSVSVDDAGLITAADVVTPTAQNLANLEADMRAFAPSVAGLPEADFALKLEQLVRAYDPCLSCAVH